MKLRIRFAVASLWLAASFFTVRGFANPHAAGDGKDIADTDPKAAAESEKKLLSGTRQLTFEGRRAGEGYFNHDGSLMVFQSEREPGNPFFQIYLMDLEFGDVERISPGHGKTTCAWVHPSDRAVLFASTHDDPAARKKQKEEIELRESGKKRRYSWDYDEHFEIYRYDREGKDYTNLTNVRGYDAEGSWSPDGKLIAFASNRRGYAERLTKEEKENFEIDPAYLNDIYIMNADGSNVRRLTEAAGYDGGPFFSPDGKRICWRRFTPNGAIAEVWTMNVDGSDKRQVTRLGAMSWAPYYHPSGEYLIFTTNQHGFANFELYLVDAEGKSAPVRVTYKKGFDGLPVFSPDGKQLSWTTNRTASKRSQIFLADWNHELARKMLGLDSLAASPQDDEASLAGQESSKETSAGFEPQDIMRHVGFLCRPELTGRLTGTPGERMATSYVAAYLDSLGLEPAGDDGSWFQDFTFTAGVALGSDNRLSSDGKSYPVEKDWVPLSFSKTGTVEPAEVVFAGYGIAAPKEEGHEEYDSFVHLDVKDKWVMVFRYMPESVSAEQRQHLSRHASLRFKAMLARDKGARGLIVVSGPNSGVKSELVKLRFDGSLAGASVPVISVTDDVAEAWLKASGKSLKQLQDKLDTGAMMMGFPLKGTKLGAEIDIKRVSRHGRNVLGRLQVGDKPSEQMVVVGAHIDHLGKGASNASLARDDEKGDIHYGADDNASGIAAMLEAAQYLSDLKSKGRLRAKRDILFAAWSGEEVGLIGSSHFVKTFTPSHTSHRPHAPAKTSTAAPAEADGESSPQASANKKSAGAAKHATQDHGHAHSHSHSIYPSIAACINMDMVGRLDKKLIVQGVGSSSIWKSEIERRNVPVGLPITVQNDSYLPTDASSFYMRGVPILNAFTGSHSDYHTPRDTPDKLNYEGAAKIANFMALVTRSVAMRADPPDYVAQQGPKKGQTRARLRAYLGTIPDYAETDVKGVKLSGVSGKGPADKAGVKAGDIIVELAGRKIENIYDYTYAIEALKIGKPVKVTVNRGGKRVVLQIVPGSRE